MSWGSPPPLAAGAAATASQPQNTGGLPFPGLAEGHRDRGQVTQEAEATSPINGSAAAGEAPAVLPPRTRAPAQPLGKGCAQPHRH